MEEGDKILTAKFSLLCNSKVDPICRQDALHSQQVFGGRVVVEASV